jgi:phosphatidylglycerol:prolipoprotein diacylglycerol transferase
VLQTLFYIPNHIPNQPGGIPIFGFGLLLAVWAVGSALFLARLVYKQGFNEDTRGYLPLLLLMGAAIWFLLPRLEKPEGLPIPGYGVMLLLAVSSAVALAAYRARRLGRDVEMILALALWAFIPGLLGARVFYVVQKWPLDFQPVYQREGFWGVAGAAVNVAGGGLVVYGAVIGGVLGTLAFIHRYKLPGLAMFDLLIPSLMLGMGIGRLGCLMNGCCFGSVCSLPWAVTFPPGSPPHFYQFQHGQLALQGIRIYAQPDSLAWIAGVEPGSAAAKAGLADRLRELGGANGKPEDPLRLWIDAIGDYRVDSVQDVYHEILAAWKPDASISLRLAEGRLVTLAADNGAAAAAPQRVPEATSSAGAEAAEGGASLGVRFSGPGNGRPIIAAVTPGSPAARQGLKAGQEVFAVNNVRVRTIDGAGKELTELVQPGVSLDLIMVEKGKRLTTTFAAAPVTPRSAPVHPSQVYDAINGLILCGFLLVYAPFRRRDGEVLALALTLYPITRFLIERIRTDEPPIFGTGMTISQNVSLIFLVSAVALWAVILLKPKGTVFPKYEGNAS